MKFACLVGAQNEVLTSRLGPWREVNADVVEEAEPTEAVQVQLSVMYLVLGSVATTTAVMSLGISRKLFTSADQLIRRA